MHGWYAGIGCTRFTAVLGFHRCPPTCRPFRSGAGRFWNPGRWDCWCSTSLRPAPYLFRLGRPYCGRACSRYLQYGLCFREDGPRWRHRSSVARRSWVESLQRRGLLRSRRLGAQAQPDCDLSGCSDLAAAVEFALETWLFPRLGADHGGERLLLSCAAGSRGRVGMALVLT